MTEFVGWKGHYQSLCDFISEFPEIVLEKSEVSIPEDLRDEFYRRFDAVRRALVEDHFETLPVDVETLRDHFIQTEKEIIETLRLDRILMPTDLYRFLHNPNEGLIRVLYNRLFDVLQGKTGLDEFEKYAVNELQSASARLFRLGYEWWAALALIKQLDPDEAFAVGLDAEYKPVLGELKEICFGRQAHHPTLRIPEFVIHSRRIDRYVAVKMALAREIDSFVVRFKPPVRPKKKTGDTSSALDSRVMLLFFMPSTEKVPVLADIYECTLNNPDWMVECVTVNEYTNTTALDEVEHHLNLLKPKWGTCLLFFNDEDKENLKKAPESVKPVAAGFDPSKLQSAIDELAEEYLS
jgi:hypothetical protein